MLRFPVAAVGPLQQITLPLVALCYAAAYLTRARTLARRGSPVPGWRIACFVTGLVLVVVALTPPVDDAADDLLVAHMAQHLLLADLAALALVLGLTGPLLAPVLRIRFFDRLRVLTHPVVAASLWALDLYLWHTPFLYQAALHHDLVHALEHACFLAFGMLLWMPLFGPLPKPEWFGNFAKLVYIVVVRLTGSVLANVLLWDAVVLYPFYRGGHGISAASDQSAAGALMMIEESVLTIALFGPLPKPEWFGNFAKLVYIVIVRLTGSVLANVLLWDTVVLYPFYRGGHGISAASDQSAAGALMMIEESLLTIALFGWLFVRAARESEERQELLDLAAERGVELSERRATRAVSAGRGAELRRRVLEREP